MDDVKSRGTKRKNKSFLKNARKYGKKGKFGRGSQINEETYQYFIRILERSKTEFDTEDERRLFADNVFEQTIGEEVNYSCNQLASRAIENLLPFVSDKGLDRFITAFDAQIRSICSDQFASHVLQKLLTTAAQREAKTEDSDNFAVRCREWVLKMGRFLLSNMVELTWNQYANYVMRTALECLSSSEKTSQKKVVTEFGHFLITWPQLADMASDTLSSGLLQTAISCLAKVDAQLSKKLSRIILDSCFHSDEEQGNTSNLFTESGTHLLDAIIAVASPKLLGQIYELCFKNKLVTLSCNRPSNFCVQRLLEHCSNKEMLALLFEELNGHLVDILHSGNTGVILALGKACEHLSTLQGPFLQSLYETLDCWEPSERQLQITPLLASFSRYQSTELVPLKVHLHGSLLLQTILRFNKPIKIVNSLISMDSASLKTLFCDPRGSHVMDAFATSQYIGEKSREKLAQKLRGMYMDLACSKHGSRALDSLWDSLPVKVKASVAEELSSKETILCNNQFGRILVNRYGLSLFRHKRSEWMDCQAKEDRKRKLFADIIGET